jgi:hypothetical protein
MRMGREAKKKNWSLFVWVSWLFGLFGWLFVWLCVCLFVCDCLDSSRRNDFRLVSYIWVLQRYVRRLYFYL